MKVSYSNYPILESLNHDNICDFLKCYDVEIDSVAELFEVINPVWKRVREDVNSNLNYISKPFLTATAKAQKSLLSLQSEYFFNRDDFYGVFIYSDRVVFIYDDSVFKQEHLCLTFNKQGALLCAKYYCLDTNIDLEWNSIIYDKYPSKQDSKYNFATCVYASLFKEYANVETKYLKPQSRIKEFSCKYINDTKLGITYLDSKWFTNLVKSDEFKVRGHFRLQPKKIEGEWTKELIWISEFKKTGYTAPAKKLSYEND